MGAPASQPQPLPGVLKAVPDNPLEPCETKCQSMEFNALPEFHRGIRNRACERHCRTPVLWITLQILPCRRESGTKARVIRNTSSGYQERLFGLSGTVGVCIRLFFHKLLVLAGPLTSLTEYLTYITWKPFLITRRKCLLVC